MGEGLDLMMGECCWYEIGTGDLEQACEPLIAGALRLVRPIHHETVIATIGEYDYAILVGFSCYRDADKFPALKGPSSQAS